MKRSFVRSMVGAVLAGLLCVGMATQVPAVVAAEEVAPETSGGLGEQVVAEGGVDEWIDAYFEVGDEPLPEIPVGEQWSPTWDPKGEVVPGQMRSDVESVPAGFTKEEADLAETLEARERISLMDRAASAGNGCQVFWPSPYEVCGAILERYVSLGGPQSFLSFPRSGELGVPDGVGRRSEFLNGQIYWHPSTGAHSVTTHFSVEWGRLGWERSPLGYPVGEETDGSVPLSRVQEFEHGVLVGSVRGLAAVYGRIREHWESLGGAAGSLGLPVASEAAAFGDAGRVSVFERGMVYWSPGTGPVELVGSMLAQWVQDPELWFGDLGFPVSAMREDAGSWVQDYQRGQMYAATALPPWRACGVSSDANKVIRQWEGLYGELKGKTISLTCGNEKFGYWHIKMRHFAEWKKEADFEGVSWMDVADMAMTKSFTLPDRWVNNPTRNSTCYTGKIYLVNKKQGKIARTVLPSVIAGNSSKNVVTAYPGGECKSHANK